MDFRLATRHNDCNTARTCLADWRVIATSVDFMNGSIRVGALACLASAVFSIAAHVPSAYAAYTITLTESAGDVVANGSGSFNLTALTPGAPGTARGFVQADNAGLYVGPASLTTSTAHSPVAGPAHFGSGDLSSRAPTAAASQASMERQSLYPRATSRVRSLRERRPGRARPSRHLA